MLTLSIHGATSGRVYDSAARECKARHPRANGDDCNPLSVGQLISLFYVPLRKMAWRMSVTSQTLPGLAFSTLILDDCVSERPLSQALARRIFVTRQRSI